MRAAEPTGKCDIGEKTHTDEVQRAILKHLRTIRLAVKEVSPATEDLSDHHGRSRSIEHFEEGDLFVATNGKDGDTARDDRTVNGDAAVPNGDRFLEGMVFLERGQYVIYARTDDTEDHRKDRNVKQIVKNDSFLTGAIGRIQKGKYDTERDDQTVPADFKRSGTEEDRIDLERLDAKTGKGNGNHKDLR